MTNIFTNITDDEQGERPVRSYKIGRNEPCPCGSGKKYKKCCARINPDKSRDYYAEKIRETRDEEKVYEFLQQAVEDYPLEPDFILPLIVYHMQNQNMEQGLRFMRRAWRIMGSDLEDDFIFSFTSMLLEKGELERAREVLETARKEKRQSSTLLMARAEIKKALKQYQQALELLEQAEELNPEDTRIYGVKIEIRLDQGDLPGALAEWYRHFDELKPYRQSLSSLKFLERLLQERFQLSPEADEEELKQKLELGKQVLSKWQRVDQLFYNQQYDRALEEVKQIEEIISFQAPMAVSLMEQYLQLEDLEAAVGLIDRLEPYHGQDPEFRRLVSETYFRRGEYQQAEAAIKKAYNLLTANNLKENMEVIIHYLRQLVGARDTSGIISLLKDVEGKLPEDKELRDILRLSSEKDRIIILGVLELLRQAEPEELSQINLNREQVTNEYLEESLYLLRLHQLPSMDGDIGKDIERLEQALDEARQDGWDNPLIALARQELAETKEEQVETKTVEETLKVTPRGYKELKAQVEMVLKYGDPGLIVREEIEGIDQLKKEDLTRYQVVAHMKLYNIEEFRGLFKEEIVGSGDVFSFLVLAYAFMEEARLQEVLSHLRGGGELINILEKNAPDAGDRAGETN